MGFCHRNYDSNNENPKGGSVQSLLGRNDVVDWDAVKNFLSCHPISTEEKTRSSADADPIGRIFVTEVVARNPPVDLVKEALNVFPDALTLNVSCFFAACRYASPDVTRILIRHLVNKSDKDACPFPWIVQSHVTAQGAKVMLEELPKGVLQPVAYSGLCPLDHMLFSGAAHTKPLKPDSQWWEKLKLMLMVEEHGTVKTSSSLTGSFHPVHTLLRRVMFARPNFFTDRRDFQHITWLLHQLQAIEPHLFQTRDVNGDYPLHVILRSKCHVGPCFAASRELAKLLLQACPTSARMASLDDRLPLHLALENGWPCHDLLLEAAPEVLQTRDIKTGMYPFQTAACSNFSWVQKRKRARTTASALDITYMLLREDPVQAARGLLEGAMPV